MVVIHFLKAIRWQNLTIIALTMYLLRYCIVNPYFEILLTDSGAEFGRGMSHLNFGLLVLSSVLIAAAGNLINDYFDLKIDRINKPEKIIIGRHIKRRVAMMLHVVFNTIAILITGYLSYLVGVIELAFIQAILIATLWFYSTDFKRRFVWGNIAIAFCVAMVPFVVWVFEIMTMIEVNKALFEEMKNKALFKEYSMILLAWTLGLSLFSFLLTLAREITKDIIDIKGDQAYNCKTIPIKLGVKASKIIVTLIYLGVAALLITLHTLYLPGKTTRIYFYVAILPLLLITIVTTFRSQTEASFKLPSLLNKVTSLIGVLFLVVAYGILTLQW